MIVITKEDIEKELEKLNKKKKYKKVNKKSKKKLNLDLDFFNVNLSKVSKTNIIKLSKCLNKRFIKVNKNLIYNSLEDFKNKKLVIFDKEKSICIIPKSKKLLFVMKNYFKKSDEKYFYLIKDLRNNLKNSNGSECRLDLLDYILKFINYYKDAFNLKNLNIKIYSSYGRGLLIESKHFEIYIFDN